MGFDLTTFLFEIANFGLLLWVLQRVLYRPLREGIDRRRAEIDREHAAAAAEQTAAKKLRADAEERLADIEKHRETVLSGAREQAAKEEARILEHAREDAASERERVQRTLEQERSEALAWMREATVDGAAQVAGRLLQDLLPQLADDVLAGALVDSLPERREALNQAAFGGSDSEGSIRALFSSPHPPSEEVKARLRETLADLCPRSCELEFRVDESLVAGPVLRIGDSVFDASIAGHLAILRERARALVGEESQGG